MTILALVASILRDVAFSISALMNTVSPGTKPQRSIRHMAVIGPDLQHRQHKCFVFSPCPALCKKWTYNVFVHKIKFMTICITTQDLFIVNVFIISVIFISIIIIVVLYNVTRDKITITKLWMHEVHVPLLSPPSFITIYSGGDIIFVALIQQQLYIISMWNHMHLIIPITWIVNKLPANASLIISSNLCYNKVLL